MVLKRCVDVFLQALGSKKTHKNYLFQLEKFMVWNKLTDYDDLLKADDRAHVHFLAEKIKTVQISELFYDENADRPIYIVKIMD